MKSSDSRVEKENNWSFMLPIMAIPAFPESFQKQKSLKTSQLVN